MDVHYNQYENEDPRYSTPGIKNACSIRQIPVSKPTALLVEEYVMNYRGKQDHSFLISSRNRRPFSAEGVTKIFQKITASLPKHLHPRAEIAGRQRCRSRKRSPAYKLLFMNWKARAMNSYFEAYIRVARAIAEQRGLEWDVQLRVLATCSPNSEPWAITVDNAVFAIAVARKVQASGKLADLIFRVIRSILDPNHLTDADPLAPALVRDKKTYIRASKFIKSTDEIRSDLKERKHAEKLPERRAFWELTRVVFTEQPRSFLDLLRFAQAKVLILTGLRDGECVMLPSDWKRYRDHFDAKGNRADEVGGISKSLLLRHFAEKQRGVYEDSIALFETVQFVSLMFEEILTECLDSVERATRPLRQNLRQQIETGRILPQFQPGDLVRAAELYTYLTGNPFVTDLPDSLRQRYMTSYQKDYNPDVFDELHSQHLEAIQTGRCLAVAVYMYFRSLTPLGT